MRLDHFLLSPNLSDRLVDGGVDRWARGQENASDHAPAVIEKLWEAWDSNHIPIPLPRSTDRS